MTQRGRPLRFLATVLGGWAFLRLLLLGDAGGILPTRLTPPGRVAAAPVVEIRPLLARPMVAGVAPLRPLVVEAVGNGFALGEPPAVASGSDAARRLLEYGLLSPSAAASVIPVSDAAVAFVPDSDRLSGSAWLVARGNGQGGSPAPQLGGGQAGVRLVRTLDTANRVAAAGRVTTPLEGPGQEAALGVEWQPTRLPIRLVAEQRLGIDSRGGGPTVAMVGGTNPIPIAAGFALESYAATGVIGRDGLQLFAEGSARATRPAGRVGKSALAIGGGAWAATQPGATRVDVGPSVELAVPVGRRRLRAIVDWRERVGGDARPGSGPVLTLATDF